MIDPTALKDLVPGESSPQVPSGSTVRLLDADPDIGRFLTPQEREQASHLAVPVQAVAKGDVDVARVLERSGAFGALVTDGMLLVQMQLGDHLAARLIGPGDLVSLPGAPQSMLVARSRVRATMQTNLALLGGAFKMAAHHWPAIAAGLHARMSEQCERIATQLAICQLPRVEERLLSILWLLAESWGRVTPSGTTMPLVLTHDLLGALIGARRPTVTLALGELSQRGAIVQRDRGWLLLEAPRRPTERAAEIVEPSLVEEPPSGWTGGERLTASHEDQWRELLETVARLREEWDERKRHTQERLERLRISRERINPARVAAAPTRIGRAPS